MKRLANLKTSLDNSHHGGSSSSGKKRPSSSVASSGGSFHNQSGPTNPYPLSGTIRQHSHNRGHGHLSFSTATSGQADNVSTLSDQYSASRISVDSQGNSQPPKSAAPTIATNAETYLSDYPESSKAYSTGAMTAHTGAGALSSIGGGGGQGSTFSSPAVSVRSLTTTLTTIQSTAPSAMINGNIPEVPNIQAPPTHGHTTPAPALPPHLASQLGNHPTYSTATANGILTDNASILTLASSSNRRRRRSMDTDASVRAIPPSSLWGGSRESLPLSVLSQQIGESSNTAGTSSSVNPLPARGSIAGGAAAERASLFSVPGVISPYNDRASYHGVRPTANDGASVKSGIMGHGRNDSVGGSSMHPATPRDQIAAGRSSRRGSDWIEMEEVAQAEEQDDGTPSTVVPTAKDKGKAAQ
jgi:hypothetical protein